VSGGVEFAIVAAHQQHRESRPACGDLRGDLEAVETAGHHDVAEHQIRIRGAVLEQGEGLGAGDREADHLAGWHYLAQFLY
jgi:hypothetical protein